MIARHSSRSVWPGSIKTSLSPSYTIHIVTSFAGCSFVVSVMLVACTIFIASAQGPSADVIATRAEAYIAEFANRGEFHGSVVIARSGTAVFQRSYGFADVALQVENTPDTKFNIGSLTKQFTALALLQLVQIGKIRLQDPIARYYSAAPTAWGAITIDHLLRHESGISGPSGPSDFVRGIDASYTPRELVDIVATKPLEFEPGTQFKYSNGGYCVLGYVIELVTGVSYAEYVQAHIFEPVGMPDSGFDSIRTIIPKKATGYSGKPNNLQRADQVDWSLAFAAGALYSTVDDLVRWDRGLASGKLLNQTFRDRLLTSGPHRYNYGWFVDRSHGYFWMYHEGSNPGYASFISRIPEEEIVVVVLSNFDGAPVRKIAEGLTSIARGDRP
jgi:D-alanyl-D-alanine carboxypeptidase